MLQISGTVVGRFENVPVYFRDETGDGYKLFQEIRQNSPQISWQDYIELPPSTDDTRPFLIIRNSEEGLTVLDRDHRVLCMQKRAVIQQAPTQTRQPRMLRRSAKGLGVQMQRIDLPEEMGLQAVKIDDLDGHQSKCSLQGHRR